MSVASELDLKQWLSNQLADERREVLAVLAEKHHHLLAQMEHRMSVETRSNNVTDLCPTGTVHDASKGFALEALPSTDAPMPQINENHEQPQGLEQASPDSLDNKVSQTECRGQCTGLEVENLEVSQPECRQQEAGLVEADAGASVYSVKVLGRSFTLVDSYQVSNFKPDTWVPLVDRAKFEISCGMLIVLNQLIIVLETQYNGVDIGFAIGYQGFNSRASDDFPGFEFFADFVHVFCNSMFTLELLLRILAQRSLALRSFWIWLDMFIVPFSWLETLKIVDLNASIIRIFRLARTVRVVKIIRAMSMFRVLYFMVRSIVASFEALIWSFVVILSLQLCSASFCCQMLQKYLQDESEELEHRLQVFELFGTFSKSLFTMFQVLFANWVVPTRLLMDYVSPWWGLYFILYRCVMFFSFGKVISAVFITETQRLVEQDRELQALKIKAQSKEFQQNVREMFGKLDKSGDGMISRSELQQMSKSQEIVQFAKHLGLEANQFDDMFDLLQSRDGNIHIEEFVHGLPKLKGVATSLELFATLHVVRQIATDVAFLKTRLPLSDAVPSTWEVTI